MTTINIRKLKIKCSLKCGTTFIHSIKYCLERDNLLNNITIDKNIIILRNPYERIISYYLNKLINTKGYRKPQWHKNPVKQYETDCNNIHFFIDQKYKKLYNNYYFYDLSFKEFLNILFTIDINHLEPHLLPQKYILNESNIDEFDIIDLNLLTDTLIDYFQLQNINIIPYLKNEANSTIYDNKLDICCGNWKLNNYKEKGTPNNKNIDNYFDEELFNKFNNYYKDDIDIFNYYIK